jgi:Uma2 family endonuclease
VVTERRLLSVEEYERLSECGVLHEDERVELIGGELVRMAAMKARHAGCVRRLSRRLERRLGDSVTVSAQLPLAIPEYDEPEPDVAVLRPRDDDYERAHPTPDDALLVIEVADTSLGYAVAPSCHCTPGRASRRLG